MKDWFSKQQQRGAVRRRLGDFDSWLDSSLAGSWHNMQDRWNAASSFFARFRLSGWKRMVNEAASESVTLLAGGLVVMYALAIPAFLEIDESKALSTGKYSVKFLDRHGKEIGQRGILHNDSIPLEDIPEHLIQATLATEDRRFFEHFGVDVIGTFRALATNINAGETVQGGSTLTQQLAKNLFLSSERSLTRKIKELFLAFWLEARYTKREILKLYFDRAYMGGGTFGVEAAAQFYFGKSVRDVNLAEAAMMAGLFKAPTKFAPHVDLGASRARANDVLSNLVEAGFMTAGQVHAARLNPAKPIETRLPYSPDWYLDWAFEEIQRVAEGRGHFVITARTTIDLGLQQAAEQALISTLRQQGKQMNARSGALVAMEPDGAVRALVGGTDYGESQFNRATHARRQPGSSFKLYVYANAVERGLNPKSVVRDNSVSCGNWSPKNYDGSTGGGGSLSLGVAFAKSLNTVAVDLSLKYDRDNVVEMTQRLGVQGVKKTCSMALGDGGITPLQHTAAFGTFANGGRLTTPYAILEITNSRGEVIYSRDQHEPPAPQVINVRHAEFMNQMMHMVVTEGTGKKAQLDFTYTAGKTGTSSSYRDAWFVGFSGAYVTGVWIGNDDFRPMGNVTGGSIPAVVWQGFMSVAHSSMDIPQIPGLPLHPTQVAERQRLEELKRQQPQVAQPAAQAAGQQKRVSLMSDQARSALKRVSSAMRMAAGIAVPPEPEAVPAPAATQPAAAAPPAAAPPVAPPATQGTPRPAVAPSGRQPVPSSGTPPGAAPAPQTQPPGRPKRAEGPPGVVRQ
ncbi:MAG: transglycosylase domain-containing protein [Hyphomicrobiaceae bacterium]